MWVNFFLLLLFTGLRKLVRKSGDFYKICLFFLGKLILLKQLYVNPGIFLHPHDDDEFISNSTKHELNWSSLLYPRKDIPVVTCQ